MAGPKDDMYKVMQNFDKFAKEVNDETVKAVEEVTQAVFDKSQELVSVDTGALKASGTKQVKQERTAKRVRVRGIIEYGGDTSVRGKNSPDGQVRYAAAVHELQNPFLLRAISETASEIDGKVKQRYKNLARKVYK